MFQLDISPCSHILILNLIWNNIVLNVLYYIFWLLIIFLFNKTSLKNDIFTITRKKLKKKLMWHDKQLFV